MNTIGIDARLIDQTGVGVYILNLLRQLELLAPKDYHFNIYVMPNSINKVSLPKERFTVRTANFHWHSVSEQTGFLQLLNRDNLDLMHFTYFTYPIFYKRLFVITIHDLTPILYKTGKASTLPTLLFEIKHLAFRKTIDLAIKNSRQIITPTLTVKKQLLQRYRIDEGKVTVTYEGVNDELIKADRELLAKKYHKPFFMYVGNFYPHKNVARLIAAYAKTNIDPILVLVGPEDYFAKKMKTLISELKQENRIIMHHNSTIKEMVFFYKNAKALLHPSLSEGFGLPLIEATYFGCPVIGSDSPLFHEILDDHYIPFDPENADDIAQKINDFSRGKIINPKLISQKELLGRFSFEKMTKQTISIYQQVLQESLSS